MAAAKPKVVRYVGMSNVREIDGPSWKRVGVTGQSTKVVWDATNDHTVPQSELSKSAIKFLEDEGDFVVEG